MNILSVAIKYILYKPLSGLLNIILFGSGMTIIIVLLLFSRQFEDGLESNSKGIDLVIGAKGSPLQVVLCNIFHLDYPTGNIPLKEAEKITKNRLVKSAIPLALGDSYQGFRIVGTTSEFLALYDSTSAYLKDTMWNSSMKVLLGHTAASQLAINSGDAFSSQHGMAIEGMSHEEEGFIVSGILDRTGTVIDNLILTTIPNIWNIHEPHEKELLNGTLIKSRLIPGVELSGMDSAREITSVLIQYRSPIAAIQLPALINKNTSMMAAVPAFEISRLYALFGNGIDLLKLLGYILVGIASLSIFISLYNSMKERKYDLAIFRTLGSARNTLFFIVLFEGIILSSIGGLLGILFGHLLMELVGASILSSGSETFHGNIFYPEEFYLFFATLLLGLLASIIPAITAMKIPISQTLSEK